MQILAGIFLFFAGLGVIWLIVLALASVFWVWMLMDAILNPRLDGTEKIVWVIAVAFTHFIGALLYFLIARNKQGGGAVGA